MEKPKVLILQSRPEADVKENEFESICRLGGINPASVVRLDMLIDELNEINLSNYAAVILGGSPANLANPAAKKSEGQKRFEDWLIRLVKRIIDEDKPFLGLCFGVGSISTALGVRPDFEHGEETGATDVRLTDAGKKDQLLIGLPPVFSGLVGHKEGIGAAPNGCVELARSNTCVQMVRAGQNVYGTQFHPEMDMIGFALRVEAYKHHGYFAPGGVDAVIARAKEVDFSESMKVLKNFVVTYITA